MLYTFDMIKHGITKRQKTPTDAVTVQGVLYQKEVRIKFPKASDTTVGEDYLVNTSHNLICRAKRVLNKMPKLLRGYVKKLEITVGDSISFFINMEIDKEGPTKTKSGIVFTHMTKLTSNNDVITKDLVNAIYRAGGQTRKELGQSVNKKKALKPSIKRIKIGTDSSKAREILKELKMDKNILPSYETEGAAGADVFAAIKEPFVLKAGKIATIDTGLILEIPFGYENQVRPKSGLAAKHGITIVNAPGTVDSDYRGEVKVILANLGDRDYTINPFDKIGQLVVQEVIQGVYYDKPAEKMSNTKRGKGGFGHTGK